MAVQQPFSSLILAGGKSSRMGQDKATLTFNGSTLLQHMQQIAQQCGSANILLSRNTPGAINDTHPGAGPLAGIAAALPYCQQSWLLVLAIDTPLLTAEALQQLLQFAWQNNSAACFSDSPLPCVLPVTANLAELMAEHLHSGKRSVKALLAALNGQQLAPATPEQLFNTNTPAQWQQCLTLAANRRGYA